MMKVRTRKFLSLFLTLAMVAGMFVLPASAEEPADGKYILDFSDTGAAWSDGALTEAKTGGTNDYFTVGKGTIAAPATGDGVFAASDTEEAYTATKYWYSSGGNISTKEGERNIHFTTTNDDAVVKIWWQGKTSGGSAKDAPIIGINSNTEEGKFTFSTSVNGTALGAKGDKQIGTYQLGKAGTYYIGQTSNWKYAAIYKVEVTDKAPDPNALNVKLEEKTAVALVGGTVELHATATPDGQEVTWETSDPEVATVANGVVTGVKAGTATITAKVAKNGETKSASCEVTVMEDADGILHLFGENTTVSRWNVPEGVKVFADGKNNTYVTNTTKAVSGKSGTLKNVTLENATKFESSTYVLFTAPKAGTVTLYFSKDTGTGSKVGHVEGDGTATVSTGEEIGADLSYSFDVEAGKQYKIGRKSSDSFPIYLIWTASDWATKHSTHTYSEDLRVTETVDGVQKYYDYCSNPACTARTEAQASVPATSVTFEHTAHTVYIGGNEDLWTSGVATGGSSAKYPGKWKLNPTVTGEDGATPTDYTLSYTLPDDNAKEILSVDADGVITPKKVGEATVTVIAINKDNSEVGDSVGGKNQCLIHVRPYVKKVEITGGDQSVKMGATLNLSATVTTQSGAEDDQTLVWTPADTTVIGVSAATGENAKTSCVVTPKKAGSTTITAKRPKGSNPNIAQYEDDVVSDPITITVNKGEITDWSIAVQHEAHGSATSTATVTVTGIPEAELDNISVKAQTGSETEITGTHSTENKAQWTLSLPENQDTTAKTYTITATFDNSASANYTANPASKTTTVSKAGAGSKAIQVTVTGSPALTNNAVSVVKDAALTLTASVKTANAQEDVGSQVDYQWYTVGENDAKTAIDNATSATYTVPTGTLGTTKYLCTATPKSDATGLTGVTATSSAAVTVTVTAAPITAISAAIDTASDKVTYDDTNKTLTVKGGTPVTFTITTTPAGRTSELEAVCGRDDYATVELKEGKLTITPKRALKVTSSEQPWNMGVKVTADASVKWEVALTVNHDDAPAPLTADQVVATPPTTPDGKGTIKIKNPVEGTTYCYREGSEGKWTDIADPAKGVQVDAGPTHTYYVRVRVDANLVTVPTGLAVTVPSYTVPEYNLTLALTDATATVDGTAYSTPVKISADSEVVIVVTPGTGKVLPNAITIPGVSSDKYNWDTSDEGATLTLYEYALTGNTTITIAALDPGAKVTATMGWHITKDDAKAYTAETKVNTPDVKGVEFYLSGDTWKWVDNDPAIDGAVMQGSGNPSASGKKPTSGAYLHFKALQAGTLTVNFAVMGAKTLNITDGTTDLSGYPKSETKGSKTVTITAEAGKDYYLWVGGSKIAMQSYTFTTELSALDVPVIDVETVKLAIQDVTYTANSAEAATADACAALVLAAAQDAITIHKNTVTAEIVNGNLDAANKKYTFQVKLTYPGNDAGTTTSTLTMNIEDAMLVESITISGPDSVNARESITLTAEVLPADAAVKDVKWTTSDATKATVGESTGKVSGVAEGTVTITATATDGSGVSASKTITVKPADPNTFDPTFLTVAAAGTSEALGANEVTAPFGASNMNKRSDEGSTSAYAIETKSATEGAFTVTVSSGKIGKLTIDVASNGGSNTATFQMTDASGKAIANKEGITSVTGSGSARKTLTYENLSAGTYTLAPTASSAKPLRVYYAHVDFTDEGGTPTKYTVSVTGGTASVASAAKGDSVTITAGAAPEGKVFDKWTATGMTLTAADAVKNPLTFTMPEGNVSFTATYKNSGTTPVEPDEPTEASVSLNTDTLELVVGEKATLLATVTPADATVTWSSDNTAVATVSNAEVTAVAAGSAKITAKVGDKTAECTVTVSASSTGPTVVTKTFESKNLTKANAGSAASGAYTKDSYFTLVPGSKTKYDESSKEWKAEDFGENAYDPSGDHAVSKVIRFNMGATTKTDGPAIKFTTTSDNAKVQIWWVQGGGDTEDKDASGNKLGTFSDVGIRQIALLKEDLTLVAASELAHTSSTPSGTDAGRIKANDPEYTELTASTAGTYMVGSLEGSNYIFKIVVTETTTSGSGTVSVTGVSLNKTTLSIDKDKTETLVATIAPSNATNKKLTWRSSNSAVAAVDSNGKVTAVKAGTATITVTTANGKTASCAVTVTETSSGGDTPSSGGSSGGSSVPSSGGGTTVKNEDGSKTNTKTDKTTGTVTETTTWPNGDKQVVVTKKDGTVTETTTKKDGTKTETVTNPDGSTTTAITDAKGITVETATDASGATSGKVSLPKSVDSAVVSVPVKDPTESTVAVVVDAKGNETVLKTAVVNGDALDLLVKGNVSFQIKDNSKSFTDIADGYWAKGAVDFASSREIFKGTSDSTFSPAEEVNRGMMATVLYRLADAKAEGENAFFDVPNGTWYTDAVIWANRSGVVTGYADGTFGPDKAITRQEMAAMLFRYAKALKMDVSAKGNMASFGDSNDVASWASEAMTWAVGVGLINGVGDPTMGTILAPSKSASRAEVATIMQRMVKLMMQ